MPTRISEASLVQAAYKNQSHFTAFNDIKSKHLENTKLTEISLPT